MRKAMLLAAALFLGAAAHAQAPASTAAPSVASCAPEAQIMMLQDPDTFDASPRGWRRLLRDEACEPAAVTLIERYIAFQGPMLQTEEVNALRWHEGLLQARIGKSAEALKLMTAARAAPGQPDFTLAYMDATIAFLKHDKTALQAARTTLAAVPKPADYDRQAAEYTEATGRPAPPWPPNLDAVDALIRCFDKTYREAQSDPACRA